MTGSAGAWIGRIGLAAAVLLWPFSDLVQLAACSPDQACWPPLVPAALTAVSAAAIVVIAGAGGLGRNVYDELRQDVLERTRANGWEDEAAADHEREVEATRAQLAELAAELKAATLALAQARGDAGRQGDAAVRDAKMAAAAELARVKREAEETLAARLLEVRAEAARERDAAVRQAEAAAEARQAARATQARQAEIAAVRNAAELALSQALERARAEADRQRDAAVRDAKMAAEAELARVKREAAETLARVQAAADAAVAPAGDAAPLPEVAAPAKKQTIEEHIEEARAQLARHKQAARRAEAAG